jgi:hypothetical protein
MFTKIVIGSHKVILKTQKKNALPRILENGMPFCSV